MEKVAGCFNGQTERAAPVLRTMGDGGLDDAVDVGERKKSSGRPRDAMEFDSVT
jgi:hypothetical protein